MPDRVDRYFAHEASEYLEQLAALLAPGGGAAELTELLRLSGGVRGSAAMAGADSVAAVAEQLEEGFRSVQAGQLTWSEDIRELALQTVRDLEVLVRASAGWAELDDQRVLAALERWKQVDSAPVIEIEALFHDDEGPHVLTPDHEVEMLHPPAAALPEPVPIESLLLDRDAAVREALSLREALERALREVPGAEVELGGIVRELFELLEIASTGGAAAG